MIGRRARTGNEIEKWVAASIRMGVAFHQAMIDVCNAFEGATASTSRERVGR